MNGIDNKRSNRPGDGVVNLNFPPGLSAVMVSRGDLDEKDEDRYEDMCSLLSYCVIIANAAFMPNIDTKSWPRSVHAKYRYEVLASKDNQDVAFIPRIDNQDVAFMPSIDASATPSTHADGTPLLSLTQPPPIPVIIIQNNYIAEGGTINILSSNSNGSTVTKLDHAALTAEPTPLSPPLVNQQEPEEHCHGSVVLSGNTFGECVMINVASPNCTGAIKQTALASRIDRNI
ncbi:hypothetical protein DFJ58DRAFT_726896 [Suillus subalutaceus]|uniref:uncharacterized protein n=1 Tax=Suillus subalutaceus TaxID=48586 RepID=UPI001B86168F|nr:uncharacterized protein DFJ58DRAFT_726896 [Suillus subalutaceus]KAG1857320.1 hypothetical protein DFJ58DRAFT_726896 [Suillus subalutaceus]